MRSNHADRAARRASLAIALFALLAGMPVRAADPQETNNPVAGRKPNVIILLADDLGYGDVGFNGRREWTTANLDHFAQQGTIFRRWYTAGVVCAPSRAALMTGRYGIHNGVTGNGSLDLPSEEITLAEALKARGYATALFGKWHHGAPQPGKTTFTHPMDQGFDEFFGFTDAVHAWQKFPTELWMGRERKPSQGYADTLFTDHAIDFLKRHKDQPFFCYVPYIASHGQLGAPAEDIARFKGKFPDSADGQPLNAIYAAEVFRLDMEIGRILQTLDELKLADDTIVIFTSDHGATFETMQKGTTNYFDSNAPFRGQKRTLWEGGMRVPAIVRWPGQVPAGLESHAVIHMCDVFPTILAAAGVPADTTLAIDGQNMLDVLRNKAKPPERVLFWEWRESDDMQYAAMHGDLKLVITGDNQPELFNVESDPAERRNLKAEHPDEVKRLNKALQEWLATESEQAKLERGKKKSAATGGEKD